VGLPLPILTQNLVLFVKYPKLAEITVPDRMSAIFIEVITDATDICKQAAPPDMSKIIICKYIDF